MTLFHSQGRGGLFALPCQVKNRPSLLALVDEEGAGVESLPVRSRDTTPLCTFCIKHGATVASEVVGQTPDMSHDHQSSQAHPSYKA